MTQKVKARPLMILLSSLMGLEQDYNNKMHAGNTVFFDKYKEEQAGKAYALYSKLLRERVKEGDVLAAFTDQKFLIEVKEVKDRDTKEVKEKSVYIQELLIFSNPAFEAVNKALLNKVQAEVPFEKSKAKGPGANSEKVVKLSEAEDISYDDFAKKAKEAQETLKAFSKRGKALGNRNKAPEPEPEPKKVTDEMPFANKVGGKKITGGTKTKDAPVYHEPEPEPVEDPAGMFAERLEAIEKIGLRIKKVQKIVDLDDDDDDAALLLAKLLKKQKRLIKEKEELEELLKDDDDDDDLDSDSDFSDLDDSDDDDDDDAPPVVTKAPAPKKGPATAKAKAPVKEKEPAKAPNIQPEKVRRSRPKI